MPECEIGSCVRINCNRTRGQITRSRGPRRNRGYGRYPLSLPDGFIVAEEERPASQYWSAQGCSKLVSLKGWDRLGRVVEVILGIEFTVAKKLVQAAMKSIRSRARDCIDHTTRGLAIFRRVIARKDREFLNCI